MIESLTSTPPVGSVVGTDASQEKFREATLRYTLSGWYVVRQKSDLVELRKPKRFSFGWAAAWMAVGVPLPGLAAAYTVGYAIWHVVKKEKAVIVYMDTDGTVKEAIPPDRM